MLNPNRCLDIVLPQTKPSTASNHQHEMATTFVKILPRPQANPQPVILQKQESGTGTPVTGIHDECHASESSASLPSRPKLGDFTRLFTQLLVESTDAAVTEISPQQLRKPTDRHRQTKLAKKKQTTTKERDAPKITKVLKRPAPVINDDKNSLATADTNPIVNESNMPVSVEETDEKSTSKSQDNSMYLKLLAEYSTIPLMARPNNVLAPLTRQGRKQRAIMAGVTATSSDTDSGSGPGSSMGGGTSSPFGKPGCKVSLLTWSQRSTSLNNKLEGHRLEDAEMCLSYGQVGVRLHVFVDMSNIIIGFYSALKRVCRISKNAIISPTPEFSFNFLAHILIRDREVVKREIVGSLAPNRTRLPPYIKEAISIGFRADIKRRVQDGQGTTKEDRVDETAHLRMGESIMDYPEAGTMVIATGDGAKAELTDGFYAYARRALLHGWNVEVVSWRAGLSSVWTSREWTDMWGPRFRIVYLDNFLTELLDIAK